MVYSIPYRRGAQLVCGMPDATGHRGYGGSKAAMNYTLNVSNNFLQPIQ